jgi:hypothetical protein
MTFTYLVFKFVMNNTPKLFSFRPLMESVFIYLLSTNTRVLPILLIKS